MADKSIKTSKKGRMGMRLDEVNAANRYSEIYRKASDLFVRKGYHGTSMSMIAEALGMSKGHLYYYCRSKEELLYRIHLDYLREHFIPIIEEASSVPDPRRRMCHFLTKFTHMCTLSPATKVHIHEVRSLSRAHQHDITEIWRKGFDLMRNSIKELQRSGAMPKLRESFLTFMWSGMVFWIPYWFDYSRRDNLEELADTIVKTFELTLDGGRLTPPPKKRAAHQGKASED